jgi:hypothetical protein
MKLHALAAALLAAGFAAPAMAAETVWVVAEGDRAGTRGSWSIEWRGETITGTASMRTALGAPLTYQLTGRADNREFTLTRINPSDRVACTYLGKLDRDGGASGTVICGKKQSGWTATRAPSTQQ